VSTEPNIQNGAGEAEVVERSGDEAPGRGSRLPVPAMPSGLTQPVWAGRVPAVQAAALAATGFVAGATTAAVVARRRSASARRRRRRKGAIGEIVSSNSFLVDVHLVRRD
jgi:anti-sigma factor RsiW